MPAAGVFISLLGRPAKVQEWAPECGPGEGLLAGSGCTGPPEEEPYPSACAALDSLRRTGMTASDCLPTWKATVSTCTTG